MSLQNTLSRLNSEQQQAVRHIRGPLLVLAGAGSGKTRVITHKMAYLIRECGYAAKEIVALTFTNKAAKEMQERAGNMLTKQEKRGLWVSTFHTLGLRILKEDGKYLGLLPHFTIADQRDSLAIIKQIAPSSVGAYEEKDWQRVLNSISIIKNAEAVGQDPVLAYENEREAQAEILLAKHYQAHLRSINAVDFDDLILYVLALFKNHPEVLQKWQRRIRYLLLDEYQDTNPAQYELVKYLAGISANFTAVGDDDQSIYAFRGALSENLKRLASDFANLSVIKLEQNYRCDKKILSAANKLIAVNPHLFEKSLWSTLEGGEPVRVMAFEDEEEEAEKVVENILTLHKRYGAKFSDFVVLYRSNYQSRLLETALRGLQIPYVISGSTGFFEHSEVRDLLAYLRLIANPDDQQAFMRAINTPKRGIGTVTLEKLNAYAHKRQISPLAACLEFGLREAISDEKTRETLYEFGQWIFNLHREASEGESPSKIFEIVLGDLDYMAYLQGESTPAQFKKREQRVLELARWIARLSEREDIAGLAEAIWRMQLLDMLENQSKNDDRFDAVSLMTLHAAKGLEFAYVFIIGLEEGFLPHKNSLSESAIEEERRLLYVGMTRAQYALTLTLAKTRRVNASTENSDKKRRGANREETTPSRFLDELPAEEISWHGINETPMTPEEEKAFKQNIFANLLAQTEKDL